MREGLGMRDRIYTMVRTEGQNILQILHALDLKKMHFPNVN